MSAHMQMQKPLDWTKLKQIQSAGGKAGNSNSTCWWIRCWWCLQVCWREIRHFHIDTPPTPKEWTCIQQTAWHLRKWNQRKNTEPTWRFHILPVSCSRAWCPCRGLSKVSSIWANYSKHSDYATAIDVQTWMKPDVTLLWTTHTYKTTFAELFSLKKLPFLMSHFASHRKVCQKQNGPSLEIALVFFLESFYLVQRYFEFSTEITVLFPWNCAEEFWTATFTGWQEWQQWTGPSDG